MRGAVDERTTGRHAAVPLRRQALAVGLIGASTLVIGVGVGPAGAHDRVPGPWHRDGGRETSTTTDRENRDERSCAAPAAQAPTTAPAPTGGAAGGQTLTVVVPPIVRVESDVAGALGVVTNAARPPAPGDQVYRLLSDGSYAPADEALVTRVMTARWTDRSWCSTIAVHHSAASDDHHEN
jgi:hypothetical protein